MIRAMNPFVIIRWMLDIVGRTWASCTHFSHWRENVVSDVSEC